MYKTGEIIVYSAQGVCRISGTEEKRISGNNRKYLMLKPIGDTEAVFCVPMWNETALSRLRKVMSKDELNAIIDAIPDQKSVWIGNENERKEAHRRILTSGDQAAIVSMIRSLYLHKKEREAEGKRLHIADENIMKEAEQLLYNEWQYVLDVDRAGLLAYITRRIAGKD